MCKNPIELVCKSVITLSTIYNCRYLWCSVSCSDVLYIVLYRKNKYLFYFTVRVINIGILFDNNVLYIKAVKNVGMFLSDNTILLYCRIWPRPSSEPLWAGSWPLWVGLYPLWVGHLATWEHDGDLGQTAVCNTFIKRQSIVI